ncbi:hypothetical protein CkaCkLH20_00783 [Colletotrichum karsti]|uniref:Uncharacterized protein n=1 Tax=Colletotrichum karsti TaxID=1095194 RepID=A0A9P6IDY3_9PEZI|nr:uncharacterized protein CkaCkLH20_00783 [Colletotrichum karsti]KAF9881637.1 hypothetical protein CkaCkLH20_00783 [Colletotrichum karsti]
MFRLSKNLKPIFLLANSIAPITTSASQISPMPASLILGGITCILSSSTRLDEYQEKVIETLEWMGDEIDLINLYRKDGLFKFHGEVESFELKIAADILRFCARVADMFYHKDGRERNGIVFALKAQCKDFDTKFGDIKEQFKSHLGALKNRRSLANAQTTQKTHDKIHAIGIMLDQQISERRGTLEVQVEDDLRKENEQRRRRLLSLIPSIDFGEIHENNFERDDEVHPMAYAYCTSTQSKTRMTLNNLLGCILGQLYKYLHLSDGVENLLSKADVGVKEELSRTEMKEGIKTPYKPINHAFCTFSQIRLDSGVNDDDIKTYISQTVDEINPDPSPEELAGFADIKNLMFRRAGGLFLWVHFRAKQFKEIGTVEDIKEALEDTTEGLDELYGEEIRKVLNHPSRFVRDRALRALMWVTNSYRSLSKLELLEALAMKSQGKGLNRCQRLPRDFSISTECADLINEDHGFYRLRHASLRDFLLSELPILQAYGSLQQEAHTMIADTCLTYLNLEAFQSTSVVSRGDLRQLQSEYPLLDYAASFWGQHFAQATVAGKERLDDVLIKVLGNDVALRLSIQIVRYEEFERGLWSQGQPTSLHALAIFNLVEIAESMGRLKACLQQRDEFDRLPIEYAILHSSREMAIWILDRCLEIKPDTTKAFEPSFLETSRLPLLHNSAARNWDDVIRRLIALGLDPNESPRQGALPYTGQS